MNASEVISRLTVTADDAPTDGGTTKWEWEKINIDKFRQLLSTVNFDNDTRMPFNIDGHEFSLAIIKDTSGRNPRNAFGYNLYQLYEISGESPKNTRMIGAVYQSTETGELFWALKNRTMGGEVPNVIEGLIALMDTFNTSVGPHIEQIKKEVLGSSSTADQRHELKENIKGLSLNAGIAAINFLNTEYYFVPRDSDENEIDITVFRRDQNGMTLIGAVVRRDGNWVTLVEDTTTKTDSRSDGLFQVIVGSIPEETTKPEDTFEGITEEEAVDHILDRGKVKEHAADVDSGMTRQERRDNCRLTFEKLFDAMDEVGIEVTPLCNANHIGTFSVAYKSKLKAAIPKLAKILGALGYERINPGKENWIIVMQGKHRRYGYTLFCDHWTLKNIGILAISDSVPQEYKAESSLKREVNSRLED